MVDQLRATYTIDEAARILGVGRNLVYRSAERGELAQVAIRIGRRVLIPREALHRLLAGESTAPLDEQKEAERVSA
jgi:excisionase family DNA binding protein